MNRELRMDLIQFAIISAIIILMLAITSMRTVSKDSQHVIHDTVYVAQPDTIDLSDGWVLVHNGKSVRRFK